MVGLELVELHFEVRRRQDVGEDHGVEVHGLLVAPQRQHVALLARHRRPGGAAAAAARLLLLLGHGRGRLVLRLRVAGQRGAVVGHVAAAGRRAGGREEEEEGAKLDRALRDNGPGPTPWKAVGAGSPPRLCPSRARGLPLRRRHTDPGPRGRTPDAGGGGGENSPGARQRERAAEERGLFRQLPLGTRWRAQRK